MMWTTKLLSGVAMTAVLIASAGLAYSDPVPTVDEVMAVLLRLAAPGIPAASKTLADLVGDQITSSGGSGLPVSSLIDLSTLSDLGASLRGKHYFIQGGTGEEDKEFVVVKDEADAYVLMRCARKHPQRKKTRLGIW